MASESTIGIDTLLDVLRLEPVADGRFRADNAQLTGGSVVFGGQLLAQSIVAAATVDPTKEVKSIHTVFSRGASLDSPLDITLDVMATGRAFASTAVTVSQTDAKGRDRVCTRSLVLLNAADPDLIRHQDDAPGVGTPEDASSGGHGPEFWEVRTVGGVDISDPAAVGPAELRVWTRFDGAPKDQTLNRALLAFATDGFLIGTAMRPHEGIGQSMAHVSISTTVVTHTLTFHEDVDAGAWLLLDHESPYAGRGRSYGRANVFAPDGGLVASFVQENMIRDFPEGQAPAAGQRSAH